MIELKNINKTYVSKSKRKVHVLKDLNLNFPEKGLCIIEGVSGAGKTTLLNIIGGLDKNFKGEYYYLGKKLQTSKDFANLRRDHVSFVFQDFNLIKDLTVAENISMGLRFSNNEGKDKIQDALSRVGLSGYEEKYPNECSGGEQQRIAIARTMLKDSSMLIADEPTGNLDEKAGRGIFDILKEIAKEKLVIVVTHDEQFGNEYADYTIQLKDGASEHNLPETITERKYEEKKLSPITNKNAFKMAWHEFTRKKVLAIINTFLLVFCFLVLSFSFSLSSNGLADIQYRLIVDQDYEYICYPFISGAKLKEYESQGVKIIHSNKNNLYFMSKQQAEDYGIKFYDSDKTMELSANVYYLSDYCAQKLIFDRTIIFVDGEEIRLDPETHTPTDLIGASCPMLAYNYNPSEALAVESQTSTPLTGICGGLYYSDFNDETYDDQIARYSSAWKLTYICLPQYRYMSISDDFEISVNTNSMRELGITSSIRDERANYVAGFILKEDNQIEWFDNVYDGKFLADLKENEVYIPIETYNEIYQTNYSINSLVDFELQDDDTTFRPVAKLYPEEIGKNIDINITNIKTKDSLKLSELKIKGVIGFINNIDIINNMTTGEKEFSYTKYPWIYSPTLYVTDINIYEEMLNMPTPNYDYAWIQVDSVKDLKAFVRNHYDESHSSNGISKIPTYYYESDYKDTIREIKRIIEYLMIIFIIVTVISLILTISMQVKGRTHELAIFKALGAQNRDISKIYLFEMLILSALTLPISILGAWGANRLINKLIVIGIDSRLSLWGYDLINIPIIIGIGVAFILIALIAPLYKIIKLNIIDAIKIK